MAQEDYIIYHWKHNNPMTGECDKEYNPGLWNKLTEERKQIVAELDRACVSIETETDLPQLAAKAERLRVLNTQLFPALDHPGIHAIIDQQRAYAGRIRNEDRRRANEANARRDRARKDAEKLVRDVLTYGELTEKLAAAPGLDHLPPLELDHLKGETSSYLARSITSWHKRLAELERAQAVLDKAPKAVRDGAGPAIGKLIDRTQRLIAAAREAYAEIEARVAEREAQRRREATSKAELLERLERLEQANAQAKA